MTEQTGFAVGDVVGALGGRLIHGNPQARFTSYCIDSRYVDDGTLFVPLMGQSRDGHHFVIDSISKGATAALVRAGHHQIHEILGWLHERATRYGQRELEAVCIIEVRHTLIGLQKLSEWYRKQHSAKLIGITGSVGKTGIKEMLIQALSEKFSCVGTEKNFNNEIGVPLALSRLTTETDIAVIEMAMRARGEISLLSRIAHPDIVMISNTSGSHVGRLGSFDEIYRAKAEIVDGLAPGGTLLLNRNDPNLPLILDEVSARRPMSAPVTMKYFDASAVFARSGLPPFVPPVAVHPAEFEVPGADVWIEDFETLGLGGSRFKLCSGKERVETRIPLLGRGIAENFAAVALAALEAGMSLKEVSRVGGQLLPSPQRLHKIELNPELIIIDDCYNSSPASARDSLELLYSVDPKYRKIAILGDMLELGKYETLLHRQVAQTALNMPLEALIAVGPRMNAVNEVEGREDIALYYMAGRSERTREPQHREAAFGAPRYQQGRPAQPQQQQADMHLLILDDATADRLTDTVLDEINEHPGPTVVLVKGSRAMHLERVVTALVEELG